MNEKINKKILISILLVLANIQIGISQEDTVSSVLDDIQWQPGPCIANLGEIAEIRIPAGYQFANGEDTRILMKYMGNIPSNEEIGMYLPETGEWFVVFEFAGIGYVKDDEKSNLDSDALLKSIKKGTEAANKIRKKNGFTTLEVLGWKIEPHYDEITHNLEWTLNAQDENGVEVINHNTRILGRKGVMSALLVIEPSLYEETLPKFRESLADFSFSSGHKYSEFRQGDEIAKLGLTALIAGGAATVAAKTGVFKWLWKVIVASAVAVGAFFKKLFGKKKEY